MVAVHRPPAREPTYLKALGAAEIIDRAEFSAPGKPLDKERWAGVVDVGGQPHARQRLCGDEVRRRGRGLRPGAGHGLPGQRGALHPARRHAVRHRQRDGAEGRCAQQAWSRLASDLDLAKLDSLVHEIPLADAIAAGADILAGKVRGRLVVDVNA